MIHPLGDHNHRSYFLQNQKPVISMERSTDFFRFNTQGYKNSSNQSAARKQ
ncbi:MAG: hypothetical protein P8179_06555 [Candidatus Thiodiazotropha sp.]